MTLTINAAFDKALSGTLTQGELLKMFCKVSETSKEVNDAFDRKDMAYGASRFTVRFPCMQG